jgi:hypothetical protein
MIIKSIVVQILEDAKQYLKQMDQGLYAMPLDLLFGASIGQHTRHFVEFYQCLLSQIEHPPYIIDYAKRTRDLNLETDPAFTVREIDKIIRKISVIRLNMGCQLECSDHLKSKESLRVASSLERELIYNIEHTIHHLAIIKIGIKSIAPNLKLPEHFGVAPSTIKHRQDICAQ